MASTTDASASCSTAAAIDAATLSVSQLCICDDGMATVKTIGAPTTVPSVAAASAQPPLAVETKTIAPSTSMEHVVIDTSPSVVPAKRRQKVALAPGITFDSCCN